MYEILNMQRYSKYVEADLDLCRSLCNYTNDEIEDKYFKCKTDLARCIDTIEMLLRLEQPEPYEKLEHEVTTLRHSFCDYMNCKKDFLKTLRNSYPQDYCIPNRIKFIDDHIFEQSINNLDCMYSLLTAYLLEEDTVKA